MSYFVIDELPNAKGKYIIGINFNLLPEGFFHKVKGSYNIWLARLMNINYADFCRLCRDEFGATIIGKDHLYPVPYFNSTLEANKLIRILNYRMTEVLKLETH